jgi:hypothetical protein
MVIMDQYILFRMILLGLDTDVGFIKLNVKNKVNVFDWYHILTTLLSYPTYIFTYVIM